jgi:hypothetical protein
MTDCWATPTPNQNTGFWNQAFRHAVLAMGPSHAVPRLQSRRTRFQGLRLGSVALTQQPRDLCATRDTHHTASSPCVGRRSGRQCQARKPSESGPTPAMWPRLGFLVARWRPCRSHTSQHCCCPACACVHVCVYGLASNGVVPAHVAQAPVPESWERWVMQCQQPDPKGALSTSGMPGGTSSTKKPFRRKHPTHPRSEGSSSLTSVGKRVFRLLPIA